MQTTMKIPEMPELLGASPAVVQVLDRIRRELSSGDSSEEHEEFCWFAREYPRCYRYHLDCAEYRLESMYKKYEKFSSFFQQELSDKQGSIFEIAKASREVTTIYWDFESFLSSISTALDILSRIVGVEYREQLPPSFSKLCKKRYDGSIALMQFAKAKWVDKMKDYRDCFVHYTPVDTVLTINAYQNINHWRIRAKLPINPNVRDILGFKYSKRVEVLTYTIQVYKKMRILDRAIARSILAKYKVGEYPKRITNLFFLGKREAD